MRIGIVGCGFTADLYIQSLKQYPNLVLAAATDKDQERAAKLCAHHSVALCPSIEEMLVDPSIEMIVNLTNSESHFEVTKACLEAGRHVYSEKPIAMTVEEAEGLVEFAKAKGLYLSTAPCSLLGETAQTLWRALRNNAIGKIRLVYAELDDGPLHMSDPHTWRSESGAPYDYESEFRSGVTMEHAEYYLSWFTAFFGPATSVTSFSSCLWPDRELAPGVNLKVSTPDFSVACITFDSGVVARLTCSLVAPYNHVMRIVGDSGVLRVDECWNYCAPVYWERYSKLRFRAERYAITKTFPKLAQCFSPRPRVYPPVKRSSLKKRNARFRMDYARGIAELAESIIARRSPNLAADHALHVTELVLAIQKPCNRPYQVKTTFGRLQPMDDIAFRELVPRAW